MFRGIINLIKGRKQISAEELDLQEALDLLKGFESDFKGNIHYSVYGDIFGVDSFNIKKIPIKDMGVVINDKFCEPLALLNYENMTYYEKYSGKKDEQHYLNLTQGKVKARVGDQILLESPIKTFLIDFIIKK